jgi:hypothetical protein
VKKPDRKLALAATVLLVAAATAVGQQPARSSPSQGADQQHAQLKSPEKRSTAAGGL